MKLKVLLFSSLKRCRYFSSHATLLLKRTPLLRKLVCVTRLMQPAQQAFPIELLRESWKEGKRKGRRRGHFRFCHQRSDQTRSATHVNKTYLFDRCIDRYLINTTSIPLINLLRYAKPILRKKKTPTVLQSTALPKATAHIL